MFIGQQPTLYPTDNSRIVFVYSLLTGRALEWATAVLNDDHAVFPSFASFIQNFKEVFKHPAGGKEVGGNFYLSVREEIQLLIMHYHSACSLHKQDGGTQILSNFSSARVSNPKLQYELACRDEGKTLEQLFDQAIHLDNLLRSRRQPRPSFPSAVMATAPPGAEPMQIGFAHLSGEERERRVRQNLCLYCGLPGRMKASCPIRPPRSNSAVSQNSSQSTILKIPVRLRFKGTVIDTTAFIDSGATGNFIDAEFTKLIIFPLFPVNLIWQWQR